MYTNVLFIVDRVSVGQEPACVKTCPTGAIRFGSKEEMKIYAEQRVADLKIPWL